MEGKKNAGWYVKVPSSPFNAHSYVLRTNAFIEPMLSLFFRSTICKLHSKMNRIFQKRMNGRLRQNVDCIVKSPINLRGMFLFC